MEKRILFVTGALVRGGLETSMYILGCGLNTLGWDVHVASLVSKGTMEDLLIEAGFSLHHYSRKGKYDLRQGQFIKKIIRAENINIVVARGYTSGVWMCLPYLFSGPPEDVVLTTYVGGFSPVRSAFHRMMDRLSARLTAKFFTNSSSLREYALNWFGISADDIVVIPNGFDVSRLDCLSGDEGIRETRILLSIPLDATVIIQVARYDPLKDLQGMLQTARRVIDNHPNVYFLLIGSSEFTGGIKYEEEVRKAHEKLGLSGRFLMPGASMNPLLELAASDIYFQTSTSESLSNALIEAMALGLPVVATDVGDTCVIVDDGKSGILVKPRDIDGMERALSTMIEDAEFRRACGVAARKRILSHYTVERMAGEYESEFLKLLDVNKADK